MAFSTGQSSLLLNVSALSKADYQGILAYYSICIFVLSTAEYLSRVYKPRNREYVRKYVHMCASLCILILFDLGTSQAVIFWIHVATLVMNVMIYAWKPLRSISMEQSDVSGDLNRALNKLVNAVPASPSASIRTTTMGNPGIVTFALSVLLIVGFCLEHDPAYRRGMLANPVASSMILVLGLGDALAAIVGTSISNPHHYDVPIGSGKKSFEGSLACFISCFIGLWISRVGPTVLGGFIVMKLVALAALATLVEAVSSFGMDNLTLPFSVLLGIKLMS